ncbi:MAG: mannose-6-phosphate isomerase, class I [Chitinophagaceae bacterium]|nr:mannose-6-phosphate isomerase, class I [Chitinophagaceae bacterium]
MNGIFHLRGRVKHYDWGGTIFIPGLLGIENPEKQPFAEYWMGTHHLGVSDVEISEGHYQPLPEITGTIEYLFKAQEVKQMLSIQVHPSKKSAEFEFARENKEGIPVDAPNRNYKDDNHKPELIVALSDFWLLHGFKPAEELHDILLNVPALRFLQSVFIEQGYAGMYKLVMEMPQEEVNRRLQPLLDEIIPAYTAGELDKDSEDFWAARAGVTYCDAHFIDRGIFSVYLFNIVKLKKGEGLFQDAGVPHAYLEGKNMEIMANSDNVLRGGLTRKHIDVKELMKHIIPEATFPDVLAGEVLSSGERVYRTTATEFELSLFELESGQTMEFQPAGAEMLLLAEGITAGSSGEKTILLQAGQPAAIVFPGAACSLTATEKSLVFRAVKPVHIRE